MRARAKAARPRLERLADPDIDPVIVLADCKVDAQLHVVGLERPIANADSARGQQVALVDEVAGRRRDSTDPDEGDPAPAVGELVPRFALQRPAGAVAI